MVMKKYHTYSFEKLDVLKIGRKIKKDIYLLTRSFPKEERYELVSQIRRSICSVTANLAEGSGRASDNDKAHFTNTSYSSALETLDHLITAYDLEYINEETYEDYRVRMDELINKLNAYYKYQVKRADNLKNRMS